MTVKRKSLCSDLVNKLNINYILHQRRREGKAVINFPYLFNYRLKHLISFSILGSKIGITEFEYFYLDFQFFIMYVVQF